MWNELERPAEVDLLPMSSAPRNREFLGWTGSRLVHCKASQYWPDKFRLTRGPDTHINDLELLGWLE